MGNRLCMLATPFQINGVNYSMSSACSTSAHCIGHAMELIQLGKQDVMFAGSGEELHWTMSALFDAMVRSAILTTHPSEPRELTMPGRLSSPAVAGCWSVTLTTQAGAPCSPNGGLWGHIRRI